MALDRGIGVVDCGGGRLAGNIDRLAHAEGNVLLQRSPGHTQSAPPAYSRKPSRLNFTPLPLPTTARCA